MGTIKSVQSSMGYIAARDRQDCCVACKHFEQVYQDRMPPYDRAGFECRKGGFYTSQMAVCGQHQPKKDAA